MNEEFLYYLWTYQLFDNELITTSGEPLKVISTGIRNTDSGPDFFNALIEIGNTKWAGNVEIHVVASDWFKHGHHNDQLYDNIILHVVYEDDTEICRANNEAIPTLKLFQKFDLNILNRYQNFLVSNNVIPCGNLINTIPRLEVYHWFDRLMIERLEDKTNEILTHLKNSKGDLIQIFYQKLARSLGYTTNADSMEMLAMKTPLKLLLKHITNRTQLEALLFGQSGLLSGNLKDNYSKDLYREYEFLKNKYSLTALKNSHWRFMRMRPAGFPTLRISQLAMIIFHTSGQITKLFETDNLVNVTKLLSVTASQYWDNHYRFNSLVVGKPKKLGKHAINLILINTIIPFLFVFGKKNNNDMHQEKALKWLSQIASEDNKIVREYINLGITPANASESQALLHLKQKYCDAKKCLHCEFGYLLLKG